MARMIIRLPGVMHRTGKSRSTIYRGMAAGSFPQAVVLGENSIGWYEHEIDEYIESRPRVVLTAPAPKDEPTPNADQPVPA